MRVDKVVFAALDPLFEGLRKMTGWYRIHRFIGGIFFILSFFMLPITAIYYASPEPFLVAGPIPILAFYVIWFVYLFTESPRENPQDFFVYFAHEKGYGKTYSPAQDDLILTAARWGLLAIAIFFAYIGSAPLTLVYGGLAVSLFLNSVTPGIQDTEPFVFTQEIEASVKVTRSRLESRWGVQLEELLPPGTEMGDIYFKKAQSRYSYHPEKS